VRERRRGRRGNKLKKRHFSFSAYVQEDLLIAIMFYFAFGLENLVVLRGRERGGVWIIWRGGIFGCGFGFPTCERLSWCRLCGTCTFFTWWCLLFPTSFSCFQSGKIEIFDSGLFGSFCVDTEFPVVQLS
jgi:hypothetical protein